MEQDLLRIQLVAVGVAAVLGLGLFGLAAVIGHATGWRKRSRRGLRVALGCVGLLALVAGCFVYGLEIEADWLSETDFEVPTPKLRRGEHLRLVLLSDLHVSGPTKALAELPERVNALQPDVLLFAGDSLNSAEGLPELHRVLKAIHPRFGRYAVKGNHDVWYWDHVDLFGDGVATELTGTPLEIAGGELVLCGAPYGLPTKLTECLLAHPSGLRVVAYHTPDYVEDLASLGPDVYVAGHTHGGQVRIPFYGAIATLSKFGKKYEMGRYQVGPTTLVVTRGIGFEPAPAPRVRFLCRPEIVVIDLVGTGS
jgi:uncharacterized protein